MTFHKHETSGWRVFSDKAFQDPRRLALHPTRLARTNDKW